jgi:hypothetical protein
MTALLSSALPVAAHQHISSPGVGGDPPPRLAVEEMVKCCGPAVARLVEDFSQQDWRDACVPVDVAVQVVRGSNSAILSAEAAAFFTSSGARVEAFGEIRPAASYPRPDTRCEADVRCKRFSLVNLSARIGVNQRESVGKLLVWVGKPLSWLRFSSSLKASRDVSCPHVVVGPWNLTPHWGWYLGRWKLPLSIPRLPPTIRVFSS